MLAWLGAGLLGGIGCRQVIGIEDAELDPTLSRGAGSGAVPDGLGAPLSDGGDAQRDGETQPGGAQVGASGAAELVGAGGAAGSPAQVLSLCDRYCAAVMQSCQGAFAVYTSNETCLAACALLPAGEPGDRDVNSIECRLHAASIAGSEVPHYCPIAGPGGNGECGTNCEGYCSLMGSVCAEWLPFEQAKCLTDCKKLPDLGSFTSDVAGQDYAGNHVQCRLYHVCAALTDDAEQHCQHAAGALPCK